MQVTIRADASEKLGAGHVMRCLALAQALQAAGAAITFVSRELPGYLQEKISGQGHGLALLAGSDRAVPGQEQPADAALFTACLRQRGLKPDWVVVDNYGLGQEWEAAVAAATGCRLMVIDDLPNRPHACSLLLDQNTPGPAAAYRSLVPADCRLLLGPHYALLRPEFAALRPAAPPAGVSLRRIFVSFGGSDAGDDTGKALAALAPLPYQVDIVLGGSNPNQAKIQAAFGRHPGWRLFTQVDNMAELMAQADLAIGAGGSTSWERCCLGLPAIIALQAENQQAVAALLAEKGAAICLGEHTDSAAYAAALASLTGERLGSMARQAYALADGRGAARVAGILAEMTMGAK